MRFEENAFCTSNLEHFAAVTARFLYARVPVPGSSYCGIFDSKRFIKAVTKTPNKRMLRCVAVLRSVSSKLFLLQLLQRVSVLFGNTEKGLLHFSQRLISLLYLPIFFPFFGFIRLHCSYFGLTWLYKINQPSVLPTVHGGLSALLPCRQFQTASPRFRPVGQLLWLLPSARWS